MVPDHTCRNNRHQRPCSQQAPILTCSRVNETEARQNDKGTIKMTVVTRVKKLVMAWTSSLYVVTMSVNDYLKSKWITAVE